MPAHARGRRPHARCSCSPPATRSTTGSRASTPGADDYLVKPFALRELRARLRALLRRVDRGADVLRYADLALDPGAHEVHRGGGRIDLSRTEFTLLELFMRHPRQVLTRTQIFEAVWGYDLGATSNALGVYIGYLRRKTEAGRRAARCCTPSAAWATSCARADRGAARRGSR